MPPQNNLPGQPGQPNPAPNGPQTVGGLPYAQPGILPAPPIGPNQLPSPEVPASVPGVQAIPQAAAAQNTAGQLPVMADNDPNSPRPNVAQQVSQVGDVSIQHAPGQHPQYGYQAPQPLQPLNVGGQQPAGVAYPPGQAPAEQPDRYAFFLDDKNQAKKTPLQMLSPAGLVPKGSSMLTKIIIFAVLTVVTMMVVAVIVSFARGSKTEDTSGTLAGIIHDQQEIIRVNKLAATNVTTPTLQNFVNTAQPALTSAQTELITYATKRGAKINAKELAAYKASAKTDEVLTAALSAGTYDATFTSTMSDLLKSYQTDLQTSYKTATAESQKTLLDKNFTAAGLLLRMLTTQ